MFKKRKEKKKSDLNFFHLARYVTLTCCMGHLSFIYVMDNLHENLSHRFNLNILLLKSEGENSE